MKRQESCECLKGLRAQPVLASGEQEARKDKSCALRFYVHADFGDIDEAFLGDILAKSVTESLAVAGVKIGASVLSVSTRSEKWRGNEHERDK
jgi:hypothetical protein